jgi:hypothetical protein
MSTTVKGECTYWYCDHEPKPTISAAGNKCTEHVDWPDNKTMLTTSTSATSEDEPFFNTWNDDRKRSATPSANPSSSESDLGEGVVAATATAGSTDASIGAGVYGDIPQPTGTPGSDQGDSDHATDSNFDDDPQDDADGQTITISDDGPSSTEDPSMWSSAGSWFNGLFDDSTTGMSTMSTSTANSTADAQNSSASTTSKSSASMGEVTTSPPTTGVPPPAATSTGTQSSALAPGQQEMMAQGVMVGLAAGMMAMFMM